MQREFLHLAYLLTKHECVIIPGVGAFVVYADLLLPDQALGIFHAPARSLGFNPELTHNDGLLAHSIMAEQGISYNEANLHIHRFVEELTNRLKIQREVNIPWLGKLMLSPENKMVFNPVEFPVCNAVNYGLSYFQMSLLPDLEKPEVGSEIPVENKNIIWIPLNKRILRAVGSIAATALLFLLFSTPFGRERSQVNQSAIFASVVKQQTPKVYVETEVTGGSDVDTEISAETGDVPATVSVEEPATMEDEITVPARIYYIVLASLPTQKMAESELTVIQSHFQQAAVINNDGRYRIYVEKFTDKVEAETYLKKFRTENPAYEEAWLLGKKGNLQ